MANIFAVANIMTDLVALHCTIFYVILHYINVSILNLIFLITEASKTEHQAKRVDSPLLLNYTGKITNVYTVLTLCLLERKS